MAACSTVVAVDIMRDDARKNFPSSCFSFFGGGEAILREAI